MSIRSWLKMETPNIIWVVASWRIADPDVSGQVTQSHCPICGHTVHNDEWAAYVSVHGWDFIYSNEIGWHRLWHNPVTTLVSVHECCSSLACIFDHLGG